MSEIDEYTTGYREAVMAIAEWLEKKGRPELSKGVLKEFDPGAEKTPYEDDDG